MKKDGFDFSFDPNRCKECGGRCCTGESGYIWVNENEIKRIAEFLKMPNDEFIQKNLIKIAYRFSIKEKIFKDGFACIFFDEKHLNCGIYDVRPNQCKTFPFWEHFKSHPKELKKECPGVTF